MVLNNFRCSGNALQSYLANWSPARQPTDYSHQGSNTGNNSRRISAFVKPQRSSRHIMTTPSNNNAVPSSGSSAGSFTPRGHSSADLPLGPGPTASMTQLFQNPNNPTPSDPFSLSTAMLPYHTPPPMWASNIFYHFALPHSQPANLSDLGSSLYGRPFHLPSPTGCTIPGCRDCLPTLASIPTTTPTTTQGMKGSGSIEIVRRGGCGSEDSRSPLPPQSSDEDDNSNSSNIAIDVDSLKSD